MDLAALKQAAPGLAEKTHYDKIKIFGWWLHVHKKRQAFTGADIGRCYTELHFAAPSSFGSYISQLETKKELIKVASGYKLENKIRETLDAAYGQSEVTVKVNNLLTELAGKLPDLAERAYYQEALICYTHGSRRAAIVMTWNVAYSHLCDHVLTKRLADFNARWLLSMPGMHKKAVRTIAKMDDFNDELKESEVITICRDAGIITKNIYNIMHAALGRRNAAAHPSSVIIDQLQTDAYIVDLIQNVILQIA
jgi:hypothetical protein